MAPSTAGTIPAVPVGPGAPVGPVVSGVSGPRRAVRALRSEWIKQARLRSTWLTLALTVVVSTGLAALVAYGRSKIYLELSPSDKAAFDPTQLSLTGCTLMAQLPLAALGILMITSEYATGTIRGTFAATPARGTVLAAKAALVGGLALVVGQVCSWSAYLVGQSVFADHGAPHTSPGDPGVLGAVIGSGLLLLLICLLGVAFGVFARSTAGALTLLTTSTLLIPLISELLPGWMRWWPANAGFVITRVVPVPGSLGPWTGLGVFAATVAAMLAVAHVTLRRRDA